MFRACKRNSCKSEFELTQMKITCSDEAEATSSGRVVIKLLSKRKEVMLVAAKSDGSNVTS